MKVAVVTNDAETISQHFGRSRFYKIITIKDEKQFSQEILPRGTGHYAQGQHEHSHDHTQHDPQGRHGFGPEANDRHAAMAREIADCDMLIAGGMGTGAYQSFVNAGLKVILTDKQNIDEAIDSLIEGNLENLYQERTD